MIQLDCSHSESSVAKRVCQHLLAEKDQDYLQSFTGKGLEYALVCSQCKEPADRTTELLKSVCQTCFEEIEAEGYWDGIIGKPEMLVRESDLRLEHERIEIPGFDPQQVVAIQPIKSKPNEWLALMTNGQLVQLDLNHRTATCGPALPHRSVDVTEKVQLEVSRTGEIAAIAETHGQKGVVIDVRSGETKLLLSRDDYHNEHSAFPLALVEDEGRTLVIHGTAWNRLDITDVHTGELLTPRSPTSYKKGETRPEHYLDYFHAGLVVSPGNKFIADNGWVWHPFGVIAVWSLPDWLHKNVWESEDGPSKKYPYQRGYFWHGSLCWLDDQQLAVWGYGEDDLWMLPAVCIYDAEAGRQVRWFAGPQGTLFFGEYLFSTSEDGTSV